MTDTMKYFEQQTSLTLCSVFYLVHPKSSSIFQSCDRLKCDTTAAQKKKQNKTKQKNKKTKIPIPYDASYIYDACNVLVKSLQNSVSDFANINYAN